MMTMTTTAPSLITRARTIAQCPPSLVPSDSEASIGQAFLATVSNLIDMDSKGLALSDVPSTLQGFATALQMANTSTATDITNPASKATVLAQRRCILLSCVNSTSTDSSVVKDILNDGYLVCVKLWLDEILDGSIGGVDLLLHLLSNIEQLPVSKQMVTSTKLGKQINAVAKHRICVGTLNEKAIKERVDKVKQSWMVSVKKMKAAAAASLSASGNQNSTTSVVSSAENGNQNSNMKRGLEETSASPIKSSKKPKTLSNILMQVSADMTSTTPQKTEEKNASPEGSQKSNGEKRKRISWADQLLTSKSGGETQSAETKKPQVYERDRLREREMLLKAKKSKLVDNDDDLDDVTHSWEQPKSLPLDPECPAVNVVSNELSVQKQRMLGVLAASYLSPEDVPSNPNPLSEVEFSRNMSQASTRPQIIPFFIPQQEPVLQVVPPPVPPPVPTSFSAPVPPPMTLPVAPPPSVPQGIATVEIVSALRLPPFLAGQNIKALQTLASSPGLLTAFVDGNGAYDQARILNLVQTLTQNLSGSSAPPPVPQPPVAAPPTQPTYGKYGPMSTPSFPPPQSSSVYAPPQAGKSGYRGDQNVTDGNLHLSGYGPMTTPEQIIQLFSPYVKVDEIVPKANFMFVNTNDPEGAKRAREALNGVMLGGSPLRINVALRRNKNPSGAPPVRAAPAMPLPINPMGQIDYDSVRDDRGNPATRNLFVAGYGQGTSETDLRNLFNQHTTVTGVVVKGSFAFVNTTEKTTAVNAREALTGAILNGGVLRINFAKESGRLGTSFDGGSNAFQQRNHQQSAPSYYGRSY